MGKHIITAAIIAGGVLIILAMFLAAVSIRATPH